MVSNVQSRPFLSNIRRKWNEKRQGDHQAETEPTVPKTKFETEVTHRRTYVLKTPKHEDRSLESPRLLRRDSGSKFFHWGQGDDDTSFSSLSSSLDEPISPNNILDFDAAPTFQVTPLGQTRRSAYFGRRPSFSDSDQGGKNLKHDNRKTVSCHLRQLALHLNIQEHLYLDKKGSCYFYLDKFLIQLQVPKHSNDMTMSTVVHRRVLNNNSTKKGNDALLERVSNLAELAETMSLNFNKRSSHVVLSDSIHVKSCYQDFQEDLYVFVNAALQIKTEINGDAQGVLI